MECQKCTYAKKGYNKCKECAAQDALALIKELTEENERLKARILAENHSRTQAEEMLANGMDVVKANTVRKMKERLEAACDAPYWCVWLSEIDEIAKEVLEDSK